MFLKASFIVAAAALAIAAPVADESILTQIRFLNGTTPAKLGGQPSTFHLLTDVNKYEVSEGTLESIVNGDYSPSEYGAAKDTGKSVVFGRNGFDLYSRGGELYTDDLEIAGIVFNDYPFYVAKGVIGGSRLDLTPTSSLMKLAGDQAQFKSTFNVENGASEVVVTLGSFGSPGTFHKLNSTNGQSIDGVTISFDGATTQPFTVALNFDDKVSNIPKSILHEINLGENVPCDVPGSLDIQIGEQKLSFDVETWIHTFSTPDGRTICRPNYAPRENAIPTLGQLILQHLVVTYDHEKGGVWLAKK